MTPTTIDQRIAEIKAFIPNIPESYLPIIQVVIERDRYENNLIGAINRTKTQETKAA